MKSSNLYKVDTCQATYTGCPKKHRQSSYVVQDGKLIIFLDGTPQETHCLGAVEHRAVRSICRQ